MQTEPRRPGVAPGYNSFTMPPIDYDSVAEIYDLYVRADYDVPFFVSEIQRVNGPVLELMAGTGRLSLPLIAAGAELACVDGSQGMLDVLSKKLAQWGLHADLYCMDVCRLDIWCLEKEGA